MFTFDLRTFVAKSALLWLRAFWGALLPKIWWWGAQKHFQGPGHVLSRFFVGCRCHFNDLNLEAQWGQYLTILTNYQPPLQLKEKRKETASINCSNFRGEQNCVELVPRAGFRNTKSRDEFDLLGAGTWTTHCPIWRPFPVRGDFENHQELCQWKENFKVDDQTGVAGGQRVSAHKLVLALSSPVFKVFLEPAHFSQCGPGCLSGPIFWRLVEWWLASRGERCHLPCLPGSCGLHLRQTPGQRLLWRAWTGGSRPAAWAGVCSWEIPGARPFN